MILVICQLALTFKHVIVHNKDYSANQPELRLLLSYYQHAMPIGPVITLSNIPISATVQ